MVSTTAVTATLWHVATPLIIVGGLVGNVLTIVVMRRLQNQQDPVVPFFFTSLAVSDTLLLLTSGVKAFLDSLGVSILTLHDVTCKLFTFLPYCLAVTSAWLLVAMTCHRVMVVAGGKTMKYRVAVTFLVIVVIVAASENVHFTFLYLLSNATMPAHCVLPPNSTAYMFATRVHPWIDAALAAVLPSIVLIVCNVLLVRKVGASLAFAKTANALPQRRQSKVASMTVTLIVTSITFVALTMPEAMILVYLQTTSMTIEIITSSPPSVQLPTAVCYLAWLTNCAVNFYLYCIPGSRFRAEVKRLFSRQ